MRTSFSRAVLSSLSAHIAVLDRDGNIIQVNAAWERFAVENGASSLAAVAVGADYLDVCGRASGPGSEGAAEALAGISAVLKDSSDRYELEYPCHSPDKQRWYLLTSVRLRMDGGGAVVSHTDITERVVAENELKRTYEFFRSLIENASDIVAIVDRAGIVRYGSPSVERVLGYRQDELTGRSCFDFIHASSADLVRQTLERLEEPGACSDPVEYSFLHKDGSWRVLEGIAKNAVDNPAVRGIVVTSRDVTERRQAMSELRAKELALRMSQRAIQAMTTRLMEAEETERRRISRELHDDLNQKLAILAVDVGSLARTLPGADPASAEKELRALQSRLSQVCGQVRTMAYQLHPLILEDLGLVVAVRSFAAEFARREDIKVKVICRGLPEQIPHDLSSTIYRIAQEALRNVAKHSRAKRATVSLSGSDDGITLTVQDTGDGFVADAAKAPRGLGLISMEERARMSGGVFQVHSRPGGGTRISVQIPWRR